MKVKCNSVPDKQSRKTGFFQSAKRRLAVMICAVMSLLSVSAFAADGDTQSTGFESVIAAMDTLGLLMTKVWTMMTSNPLLTLYLAVGLLSIGVSVFWMIKRAAHR